MNPTAQSVLIAELKRYAKLNGYALNRAGDYRQARAWNGLLALFDPQSGQILYAHDDPAQVRGWIASRP